MIITIFEDGMNGVYFYFVNKLFLVRRYWDFKLQLNQRKHIFLRCKESYILQETKRYRHDSFVLPENRTIDLLFSSAIRYRLSSGARIDCIHM